MNKKYLNIITYKLNNSNYEIMKRSDNIPVVDGDSLIFHNGLVIRFINCVIYDIEKDEIVDIVNSHIESNTKTSVMR